MDIQTLASIYVGDSRFEVSEVDGEVFLCGHDDLADKTLVCTRLETTGWEAQLKSIHPALVPLRSRKEEMFLKCSNPRELSMELVEAVQAWRENG